MNVSLTTEIEQFIQNQVESGKYTSADEVIIAGIKLLEERQRISTRLRRCHQGVVAVRRRATHLETRRGIRAQCREDRALDHVRRGLE